MERMELAERLHAAAIQLLRWARAGDAAAGLSAARLSALSVLVYGSARTVTQLAAAEQVAVPTMTRLLQGMEADGYVRRRRSATDQRVVEVTATAKGRRALEAGRAARLELIDALLAELAAVDRRALAQGVAALSGALRDGRRPSGG